MFLRYQFQSDGTFELPMIKKQKPELKELTLIGYDQIKPGDRVNVSSFVRFFLDDYKFEVIWNNPEPRLKKLSQYKGVLSPQFSAYYTMPFSIQSYQTFRSRWCGASLQSKGLTVIPTIYWGKPQSYWYCFDGIEKGCVVAVSTIGVGKEKDFFLQGYGEMLRRIKPEAIICYGAAFPEMQGKVIEVSYAESNRLSGHKKFWTVPADKNLILVKPAQPRIRSGGFYIIKTGGMILTGYGGGGRRVPMGRRKGKMPGDHERQNKQFEKVVTKLRLSQKQAEELHHEITGAGMGYHEMLEFAQQWFGK